MFIGCFSILPATDLVPGDIVEVTGMSVTSFYVFRVRVATFLYDCFCFDVV